MPEASLRVGLAPVIAFGGSFYLGKAYPLLL